MNMIAICVKVTEEQHAWLKRKGPMSQTIRKLIDDASRNDAHQYLSPNKPENRALAKVDKFEWFLNTVLPAEKLEDGRVLSRSDKEYAVSVSKELSEAQKRHLLGILREGLT